MPRTKPHSAETRAKISASVKAAIQQKKQKVSEPFRRKTSVEDVRDAFIAGHPDKLEPTAVRSYGDLQRPPVPDQSIGAERAKNPDILIRTDQRELESDRMMRFKAMREGAPGGNPQPPVEQGDRR